MLHFSFRHHNRRLLSFSTSSFSMTSTLHARIIGIKIRNAFGRPALPFDVVEKQLRHSRDNGCLHLPCNAGRKAATRQQHWGGCSWLWRFWRVTAALHVPVEKVYQSEVRRHTEDAREQNKMRRVFRFAAWSALTIVAPPTEAQDRILALRRLDLQPGGKPWADLSSNQRSNTNAGR